MQLSLREEFQVLINLCRGSPDAAGVNHQRAVALATSALEVATAAGFLDCTSDDIAVWKTTRATATDDSAAYVADAIEKDQTGGSTSDAVPKLKRRAALPVSLLDRFRRYQLHRLRRHQARLQKMQRFRLSRHRVQTAMPLLKSCV
jgi:hypothetical protein